MPEKQENSKQETSPSPLMIILQLQEEMRMLGANNFEDSEINKIIEKLKNEEIDPEKAVAKVREIRASKQDYH